MKQLITLVFLFFGLVGGYVLAGKELKVETIVKDISCFGKKDGEIELIITGGKSPYTIEWKDGVKESKRSSLAKGNYAYRVIDAKGAYVESEISINMPTPLAIHFSQNNNCLTTNLGEVNISIDGGTPLSSNWDERYIVSLIESMDAKKETYINKLKIEDANGCMLSFPVNVTYIDSKELFSKESKASPNPMAEIQIKRETNDRLVLGEVK